MASPAEVPSTRSQFEDRSWTAALSRVGLPGAGFPACRIPDLRSAGRIKRQPPTPVGGLTRLGGPAPAPYGGGCQADR